MADHDLAPFPDGVVLIAENERERVAEDRSRLLERHAVLPAVCGGFPGVPLKLKRHTLSAAEP